MRREVLEVNEVVLFSENNTEVRRPEGLLFGGRWMNGEVEENAEEIFLCSVFPCENR